MTTIYSSPTLTSFLVIVLAAPPVVQAFDVGGVEVSIQPRLETGITNYKMEVGSVAVSTPSTPGQSGSNFAQKNFTIKDTMFLFGGGATVFVKDFFADVSLSRAVNGDDNSKFEFSQFNQGADPGSSSFTAANTSFDSDFDRNEYAVSFGYNVMKELALFVGYKWSKTSIDTTGSGPYSQLMTGPANDLVPQIQEGIAYNKTKHEFKYDGPFVGVTYGIPISYSWFEGGLSFNTAVAFLDGRLKRKNGGTTITINQIDGVNVPSQTVTDDKDYFGSEGNTVGFTFGVNWRGSTSVENLTYSLGVNGYKYSFDADDSDKPDVDETVINFKVGLAYAF